MSKVLVVCTGNVCRSPVVEALLNKRFDQRGLSSLHTHSAGIRADLSSPASRFSVEVIAETESIDLSHHRSKSISKKMVQDASLIICMTADHKTELCIENPAHEHKIFLLSEMASGPVSDVSDPYGKDKQAYRVMVKTVTRLVDDGFERIVELAGKA